VGAEFFHLTPVILTDDLFWSLQSECLNSGTFGQRQAAYTIAEQQMIREIGTPLIPTTLTGTYMAQMPAEPLVLEFNRVSRIDSVVGLAVEGHDCELIEYGGCGLIRSQYGYVDLRIVEGYLQSLCGCAPGMIYQFRVAYTAGLPTGISAVDNGLHVALVMAAAQALKEIVDPGSNEGGPGAPGLTGWSAQGYSESRVQPRMTPFGQNALGNYISNLVRHLKIYRPLRM